MSREKRISRRRVARRYSNSQPTHINMTTAMATATKRRRKKKPPPAQTSSPSSRPWVHSLHLSLPHSATPPCHRLPHLTSSPTNSVARRTCSFTTLRHRQRTLSSTAQESVRLHPAPSEHPCHARRTLLPGNACSATHPLPAPRSCRHHPGHRHVGHCLRV
jgi:hypothetical protein